MKPGSPKTPFRSGFVAVLGPTNAGKSTLLNRLLGQKLAIVTPKIQTTRHATRVIVSQEHGQIVFVDTPGFHDARKLMNRLMVGEAMGSMRQSDLAMTVTSPDLSVSPEDLRGPLVDYPGPKVLVINKIDLLPRGGALPEIDRHAKIPFWEAIVPVSASTGENVEHLVEVVLPFLPEGPMLFPEDQASDRPERFFMSEIIREKVILLTRHEIPYETAVMVDASTFNAEEDSWLIQATIYVAKDSQKGIIIGAGGKMLKEIGTRARRELQDFLRGRVRLELFVKVRKDWTEDRRFLEELGFLGES